MRFCRRDQVHSSRPDPTTANWWCRRRGRHRTFLRATAAAVETVVVIWKGELSLYTATQHTQNTHTLNSSKEFVCAQIRIKITFFECAQTHVQQKIPFPQPGNRNRFLDTVHVVRGDRSRPRPNDKRARARALCAFTRNVT